MSSLQGDRDSIPTGEPRVTTDTADDRVVEAKTNDYRFVQTDTIITGTESGFDYARTVERHGGPKKDNLQARVYDGITFVNGEETRRSIQSQYYGEGIFGNGNFTQVRQPGKVDLEEKGSVAANIYDATAVSYTADLSQHSEYLIVRTEKGKRVANPENDPRFRPRQTETSTRHTIVRSVSDFRQPSDEETAQQFADEKIFRVRLEGRRVVIQSTGVLPNAVNRDPRGEFGLMSDVQSAGESLFTETEEMDLAEFQEKSGLALYIAQAELKVQNQPGAEIILNPEKSYLITGGLESKPDTPLKDFVAKEVLRAI